MFNVYYKSPGHFFWTLVTTKCTSMIVAVGFASSYGSVEMYVKTLAHENLCRKGLMSYFGMRAHINLHWRD